MGSQRVEQPLALGRERGPCSRGPRRRLPAPLLLPRGRRVAPQPHLARAAQHRAALPGEFQRAEAFDVHAHQSARDELAEHRAPRRRVEVRADAERREPVVPEAADSFVVLAEQHVDDVARAEALPGAVHAGEGLLCGLRCVPRSGGVMQLSQLPQGSARVSPKYASRARRRHVVSSQRPSIASSLAHFEPLALLTGLGTLDHLAQRDDVGEPVGHPRHRPAARRALPGPSPGSTTRCSSGGPDARRSARRACRSPSRTRWWRR